MTGPDIRKRGIKMIYLYKLTSLLVFILAVPVLPFLYLFSVKRRASLVQRLGISTGIDISEKKTKRLWIHALSVGEVKSAVPLVTGLKAKYPRLEIIFTAATATGFETAGKLFFDTTPPQVDQIAYFPYDFGFSIRRVYEQIRPDGVILVETDLWPNFLFEMDKKKIPVLLVNARLSERSLNGYLKVRSFANAFFSNLTQILVQTDRDRDRYLKLGLDGDKVRVTGNIKFDQPFDPVDDETVRQMKTRLGIEPDCQVVLAGSTHEGEERVLLNWLKKSEKKTKGPALIIAPRDPGRTHALIKMFEAEEITAAPLSERLPGSPCPDVIFVDKMGELSRLYAICDLAFVGGSLVKQGGHNPLEAAVYAKPILLGPNVDDFLEISELLTRAGGTVTAASADAFMEQLDRLLEDQGLQKEMGENNYTVFHSHSGAADRVIRRMEQLSLV